MKRLLLILAALMGFDAGAQNVPDWENPDILGVNKLPYHATLQLPSKMKECSMSPAEFDVTKYLREGKNRIAVRDKYLSQGASLADLYGENLDLLFTDLAEAHRELDVIVLGLYGLKKDATEAEMVGRLFEMINPL